MRTRRVGQLAGLASLIAALQSGCATGSTGSAFICPKGTSPVWGTFKPHPELAERDALVCRRPDGVAEGPFASWVGDKLDSVGHFDEGKLDGSLVSFEADGRIWMLIQSEEGRPLQSTQWNAQGRKEFEEVLDETGEGQITFLWYPNGATRLRAAERDGAFHGLFEAWYESGARKSIGHYEHGRKVGTWQCWDESGSRELSVTFGADGRLEEVPGGEAAESWMRACTATATCQGTNPKSIEIASRDGASCSAGHAN